MLRLGTLSLLGVLATSTLHAQHMSLGIKAGVNASTYQGRDVDNPRFRFWPAAGVLLRLPLGEHLDCQPELLYELRGACTSSTSSFTGSSSTYDLTYRQRSRLHYVSLPVLLRLHGAKWFGVTGLQLSHLVGAQRQSSSTYKLTSGVEDPSIWFPEGSSVRGTADYYRWEFGCVIGVGYQATTRLGLELRYAAGLTPVRRPYLFDTTIPPGRAEQVRNSTLQAQVSYQLGKQ